MENNKIQLHDKIFRPYIPNEKLEAAIKAEADKINADFKGKNEVPMFLCVLNGAIPFTAQLLKHIEFECELVSVKLSSYVGTKSTGTVLMPTGLSANVEGRTVIVCDDVVDTGNTMMALRDLLLSKGAKCVKIACMLFKPNVYKKSERIDYFGMAIPNDFIVGYGLDYNELGRQYKDIYVLDQEVKQDMKLYVIFGPPGSGKGTHSEPMARDYKLCHISTGDLLRAEIAAKTELGMKAKELIDKGNFVPDEVVEEMIGQKLANPQPGIEGFILDGFPRTISQAEDMQRMLSKNGKEVTGVICLMISDELIHKRIHHRAMIEGRVDDASEETINNRIRTYHEKTEPLIEYYKAQGKYFEVNADGGDGNDSIATVYSRIKDLMDTLHR